MIPKEVIEKIRRIEITTNKIVTEIFAGQYLSVFKGRGMEFDEVREYQPGDEIRTIDWNVTARTGQLHVKKFVEERELTIMLLLDVSSSCRFGTVRQLKSELAAELCAVLAFAAIRNKDKVGLIIFSDMVEKFIPPKKSTSHVLRLIRDALTFNPAGHGTNILTALEYLDKVTKHGSVCFVISDFFVSGYEDKLRLANKRHDVICVRIIDPRELEFQNAGIVKLDDAETGKSFLVDTSSAPIRDRYQQQTRQRLKNQEDFFLSFGIDYVDIRTDTSYIEPLIKFFRLREKRLGIV